MISTPDFWIITLSIAVGTYLLRAIFVFIIGHVELSDTVKTMLKYIPPSVFAALTAPPIFLHQGHVDWLGGKERVIAGLVAALVAWKTRNMILLLIVGMGTLYLLQWLD